MAKSNRGIDSSNGPANGKPDEPNNDLVGQGVTTSSDGGVTSTGIDNAIGGVQVVQPGNAGDGFTGGTNADGSPTKRRGRKPGSGGGRSSSTGKTQAPANLDGLSSMVFAGHLFLAAASSSPEFMLSEDESNKFAKAMLNVQSHYDFFISEKAQAWVNLGAVAGGLYIPRVIAIRKRKKTEKANPVTKADVKAADTKTEGNSLMDSFLNMPPPPDILQ